MGYGYVGFSASQVISNTPTWLSAVVLTSDGEGVGDITLYDGESAAEEEIIPLKVSMESTRTLTFQLGLQTHRGLYVKVGNHVERVLVIYQSRAE